MKMTDEENAYQAEIERLGAELSDLRRKRNEITDQIREREHRQLQCQAELIKLMQRREAGKGQKK